jgi:hypothetical protein
MLLWGPGHCECNHVLFKGALQISSWLVVL